MSLASRYIISFNMSDAYEKEAFHYLDKLCPESIRRIFFSGAAFSQYANSISAIADSRIFESALASGVGTIESVTLRLPSSLMQEPSYAKKVIQAVEGRPKGLLRLMYLRRCILLGYYLEDSLDNGKWSHLVKLNNAEPVLTANPKTTPTPKSPSPSITPVREEEPQKPIDTKNEPKKYSAGFAQLKGVMSGA
ncbi:hypothetical protein [Alteromonas stellipolaris]|uniref:hypothetical protein n=1 Tax=Alteromonas stellipolaris TaxID=233316 RepID=UPI001D4C96A9|nr:hypothetical protein [Alteromonas stellipolaris]MBZ2163178.1 hypothetical protein [Alteromonas stellipolaris]